MTLKVIHAVNDTSWNGYHNMCKDIKQLACNLQLILIYSTDDHLSEIFSDDIIWIKINLFEKVKGKVQTAFIIVKMTWTQA